MHYTQIDRLKLMSESNKLLPLRPIKHVTSIHATPIEKPRGHELTKLNQLIGLTGLEIELINKTILPVIRDLEE